MGKYHLPDGETLVEDLQCLVVYTPADPAYRRALWGAISQLTKYWMWEPDGAGGEHDAADSWDLAYAATLESFGMLEELLQAVDEVEPLLRKIANSSDGLVCCPDVPGGDGLVTDVPSGLEASDTDTAAGVFPDGLTGGEFDDRLCAAANAYADQVIDFPNDVLEIFQAGYSSIITLILIFTTGAFISIAGPIGAVLTVPTLFSLLSTIENLIEAINDLEEPEPSVPSGELLAVRDDLVCAIYESFTAEAAASQLRQVIGDNVTSTGWANLLTLYPHETLLAKVFNNDHEAPSADCSMCAPSLIVQEIAVDSIDVTNGGTITAIDRGWNYTVATSGQSGDFRGNLNVTEAVPAGVVGVYCRLKLNSKPSGGTPDMIKTTNMIGQAPNDEDLDVLKGRAAFTSAATDAFKTLVQDQLAYAHAVTASPTAGLQTFGLDNNGASGTFDADLLDFFWLIDPDQI